MVMLNTRKDGFNAILKEYQEMSLRYLWRSDVENGSSKDVWLAVNKEFNGKGSISRASIINFLNDMVNEGILGYHEITGKGGHRRIYNSIYDEKGTKELFAKKIVDKLIEIFPDTQIIAVPRVNTLKSRTG